MGFANTFVGVEVFTAVVKAGSLTAAAAQVGITKSAVAKSVAQLEVGLASAIVDARWTGISRASRGCT